MSALKKARWADPEYRAKMIAASHSPEAEAKRTRHPVSAETRAKIAAKHGGKAIYGDEWRAKISASRKGAVISPSHRARLSAAVMGRKQSPEWRANISKGLNRRPTSTETFLAGMLDSLFPNQYRYVGDGGFWIGGKNPDFVNVNGQKKIIELFGEHWHKPEEEKARSEEFKQYGFSTLVVWTAELKSEIPLRSKLTTFHLQ